MHQHGLNAVLEGDGAGVAGAAGAPQLQQDHAVLEAAELDVAAVLLDGGPYAGLEELLDHADDFAVVLVVGQAVLLHGGVLRAGRRGAPIGPRSCAVLAGHCHQLLPRGDGLGDQAEDLGLDVGPAGVAGLGDGDEVGAVEYGGDAVDVHQLGGERRRVGRGDGAPRVEVLDEAGRDALREHPVVR